MAFLTSSGESVTASLMLERVPVAWSLRLEDESVTASLTLERVLVAWPLRLEEEEDTWSVKLLMAVAADDEESEAIIVGMPAVLASLL